MFTLDPTDPEFQDRMYYPVVNHNKYLFGAFYLTGLTGFFAYNWNRIMNNGRLKILKVVYPVLTYGMMTYLL